MNTRNYLFTLLIIISTVVVVSCGNQQPVIEVTNPGWPDGTSVLAISEGRIVGRTRLYGDRARITINRPGACKLRMTAHGYLSSATGEFELQSGITSISLDPPIARLAIDGKTLGISLQVSNLSVSIGSFLADTPPFTTLLVPSVLSGTKLAGICDTAHHRRIAVFALCNDSHTAQMLAANDLPAQLDSLALTGVDGIVLTVGPDELSSVTALTTHVHDRGLSLSVRIRAENADDLPSPLTSEDTLPDNLILAAAPVFSSGSLNPVEGFDRILNSTWIQSFPRDRVILSFSLSASTPDGPPEEGALLRTLSETDGAGIFRLRDGSLRFGHLGTSYQYDDLESIGLKLDRLRELGMKTIGGIFLEVDGRGIIPDPDDISMIRDILQSW